jgi:hypothetical protein
MTRTGTTLVIANVDATGADQASVLEGLQPGDVLHLDHIDDPDGWWAYTVTETPAPGGTATPPVAGVHLVVDNYSGGFVRVRPAPDAPATVDFALATTPGPGGAVYPSAGSIPNGSAVWADFAGNLGHLRLEDGSDVTGATLKDWIRSGAVFNVRKDSTDPAHPNLIVGAEVLPAPPADATTVKVTSGGHGPTPNPANGDEIRVTFLLMTGPPDPGTDPTNPFPPVSVDRLRSRLDGAPAVPDATLSECIATARAILDPRCDPARFPAAAPAYVEGVTQLAVKVYETGPRGLGNLTPDAGWEALTAQATSGLYRSVLGVIAPALTNGGIVVA